MTAYVIVQLAPDADRDALLAHDGIATLLAAHQARALATPAATRGTTALPQLTLAVPDMEAANRLATALRTRAGVRAAFAKPGEALP